MHPTACLATPLIVLLQDPTCFRAWLESLPPRLSVGQRLSCTDCPVRTFLHVHAVPVDMVDPLYITLVDGQQLETPGWMALLLEAIDTSLTMTFDLTTLNLEMTAREVLALMDDLDSAEE